MSQVWYTCHADVALELRCAKAGIASAEGCPPRTLPQMLKQASEKAPDLPALKAEKPCPALEGNKAPPALKDDQWATWTWKQYYEDARKAGKGQGRNMVSISISIATTICYYCSYYHHYVAILLYHYIYYYITTMIIATRVTITRFKL